MKKWLISLFAALFVIGFSVDSVQAQTFSDVDESKEYYSAVEQLVELGSFSKAEKFNPTNEVTRGQLAKILAQALQLDTANVKDPGFKDVPKSSAFYPYIAALVQQKIVSGYNDGTYGVNNKVTRGQMAKFLVNGFQLPIAKQRYNTYENSVKSAEVLQNANTLAFYEITISTNFNPNGAVTRSQIALFISRALAAKESLAHTIVVPYTTLTKGSTVTNFGKLSYETTRDWIAGVKLNEATGEFNIIPYEAGASGLYIDVDGKSQYYYNVDIAEDFSMTYVEELEDWKAPYNWVEPMIYYGENIKKATFTLIAGGEKKEMVVSANELLNETSFVDAYNYQGLPGELWRIDIEFADGGTDVEYHFSYAGSEGYADYTEEIKLTTESTVYIGELLEAFDPSTFSLLEGDASAVQLTNIDEQLYVAISKPGYYIFTAEDDYWIYEFGITVFEIDGKRGYVYGELNM